MHEYHSPNRTLPSGQTEPHYTPNPATTEGIDTGGYGGIVSDVEMLDNAVAYSEAQANIYSGHTYTFLPPFTEPPQYQSYTADQNASLREPHTDPRLGYATGLPSTYRPPIESPIPPLAVPYYPNSPPLQYTYPSPAQNTTWSGFSSPDQSYAPYQEAQHIHQESGLILPGTGRKGVPSAEKLKNIEMSLDPRFLGAIERIIEIMSGVQLSQDGSRPPYSVLEPKRQELRSYLASISRLDPEIRQWLQSCRLGVGNDAGKVIAYGKRKPSEDGKLFMCLWCEHTLTVKNNLGNHVRSHFKFKISFCDDCNFGSVTQKLPNRHCCDPTQRKQKKKGVSVLRRAEPSGPSRDVVPSATTPNPSFLESFPGTPGWNWSTNMM